MEQVIRGALYRGDSSALVEKLRDGLLLLATWSARHRQRRQLVDLDERLLADIGLTRVEAEAEAAKPFWQD